MKIHKGIEIVTLEGFGSIKEGNWGYSAIYGNYPQGITIGRIEVREIDGHFVMSYLVSPSIVKDQVFGVAKTKEEADRRILENLVELIKPTIKFSKHERE